LKWRKGRKGVKEMKQKHKLTCLRKSTMKQAPHISAGPRVLARHEEEMDIEVHVELQSRGGLHTAASLGPSKPIQAPQVRPFDLAHKSAPIHSTLDKTQAALAQRTGRWFNAKTIFIRPGRMRGLVL